MTREALERALEALENAILDYSMGKGAVARHIEAITAIEQALAAQQEPVAWLGRALGEEEWTLYWGDPTGVQEVVEPLSPPNVATPLAAQREWVGLTPDEFQFIYDNCLTPSNLIDMVEAKLKEKNNA